MNDDDLDMLLPTGSSRLQPPDDVAERVRAVVEQAWRDQYRRRQQLRWGAMAAGIATVFVLGVAYRETRSRTADLATLAPAPMAFATVLRGSAETLANGRLEAVATGGSVRIGTGISVAGTTALALRTPGGADLRLAPGTRLQLSGAHSLELQAGALYVDAAAVAAALHVRAAGVEVRDIGTQFAVRRIGTAVDVQLREGKVEVRAPQVQRTLAANGPDGVQLHIDGTRVQQRDLAANAPAWKWAERAGAGFTLHDATVGQFLSWAAREMGVRVHYANSAAQQRAEHTRVVGDISGLPASDALPVVMASTSLTAQQGDGEIRVDSGATAGNE